MTEHIVMLSVLGEPETGLWCDDCALPSVVDVAIALTDCNGSSTGRIRRCMDCGDDGPA